MPAFTGGVSEKQELLGMASTVKSVTKMSTYSIITLRNKTVPEKEEKLRTINKQKLNETKGGHSAKQGLQVRSGKS